jgi:hypothetical protein
MSAVATKSIPCGCCQDPVQYVEFLEVRHDPDLGAVCEDCHYRIRVAVAWLKHFGSHHCLKAKPDIEERGLIA